MSATFTRISEITGGNIEDGVRRWRRGDSPDPKVLGARITSTQRNNLADGINSRLRSGLGDPLPRIFFKANALTTRLRASDENSSPAHDEWLSHYMHVPHGAPAVLERPEGDPALGDVNVENPLMAFIFGSTRYNIGSEDFRLGLEFSFPIQGKPNSDVARSAWNLGKQQRGVSSIAFEVEASPSLSVARAHKLLNSGWPYLVKFGGYFPDAFGTTKLDFTSGTQIAEIMARFTQDFRGTEEQRANDRSYRVAIGSFDFQTVLSSQYFLAPAMGTYAAPNWTVTGYPVFTINPDVSTADLPRATLSTGGTTFIVKPGYTLAGYRVKWTNASRSERITVETTGSDFVYDFTVPAGTGESFVWIKTQPRDGADLGTIVVRGEDDLLTFTGAIEVELAILERMKPSLEDCYVMLRKASTTGDPDANDTTGREYNDSTSISADYLNYGCLFADHELPQQDFANLNPVYEAARDMLRKRLRMVKRESITGYAVENGKTVLWFDRKVQVGDETFDMWDGIAPLEGSEPSVNGIVTVAPDNGTTNEWIMGMTTTIYGNDASAFKPALFGDVTGFLHSRCLFDSVGIGHGEPTAERVHVEPNSLDMTKPPLVPVAPSSWNYIHGVNSLNNPNLNAQDRTNFFRACPLYPPDYEIESAAVDGSEVKLTFKTRFRNTGEVTGDIARGAAYTREMFRTDENAIREYLLYAHPDSTFRHCDKLTGDIAELQDISVLDGGAHGSCHPRFYFCKLAEKVKAEDPETDEQDPQDTRLSSDEMCWFHFLLDAMCEGYIDPTIDLKPTLNPDGTIKECNARPANYTFPNLCKQIEPDREVFRLLPKELSNVKGFGPVPDTKIYAELFNQLAKGFNLLTKVPVELPIRTESKERQYYKLAAAPINAFRVFPGDGPTCGNNRPFYSSGEFVMDGVPDASNAVLYFESEWRTALPSAFRDAGQQNAKAAPDGSGAFWFSGIWHYQPGQPNTDLVRVQCVGGSPVPTTLVWERKDLFRVSIDKTPLLSNLADLVTGEYPVVMETIIKELWFERDANGFVPSCANRDWGPIGGPSDLRVTRRTHERKECHTFASDPNGVIELSSLLPPLHDGVLYAMMRSVAGGLAVCGSGPATTVDMKPVFGVIVVEIPLV